MNHVVHFSAVITTQLAACSPTPAILENNMFSHSPISLLHVMHARAYLFS